MIKSSLLGLLSTLLITFNTYAGVEDFKPGPVFENYGTHVPVPGVTISADETFKIAFDVNAGAKEGKVNRGFERLTRFINMHVASGAKLENIDVAMVVSGPATSEILSNTEFKKLKGSNNPNTELLQLLIDKGARILVCGQSAVAHDFLPNMFEKGVEVELSNMTAQAHLAKQGYTLIP
ncbi:MAG: DsrE family protein [Paraglaciecola sp.]|uniref:DsrE family protein n=1 Tax=Paraglaciecola sp. TaxID=1920173 RepID=UPI00329A5DD8